MLNLNKVIKEKKAMAVDRTISVVGLLICALGSAAGLIAPPSPRAHLHRSTCDLPALQKPNRREALLGATVQKPNRREALLGATAAAAASVLAVPSAHASGGATAGKTTSIPRAKLRYYDRITKAVIAFEALGPAMGSAETLKPAMKTFYDSADGSPAEEFKGAGFLLAVAFKIDGRTPPDKVQAVKDWKKMMADLDKLKAASKPEQAKDAYAKVKVTMDVYLESVDLPLLGDARYSAA